MKRRKRNPMRDEAKASAGLTEFFERKCKPRVKIKVRRFTDLRKILFSTTCDPNKWVEVSKMKIRPDRQFDYDEMLRQILDAKNPGAKLGEFDWQTHNWARKCGREEGRKEAIDAILALGTRLV